MERNSTVVAASCVLLVAVLVISIAIVSTPKNKVKKVDPICSTPGCFDTASNILKDMDPKMDPCDNFYQFACGGFVDSASIPDGEIVVNQLSAARKEIQKQLKASMEDPSSPEEIRPFGLAKKLYRSCRNTVAIEKAGLERFHKILRELGKWPVVEGDKWKKEFNWVDSVHKCGKLGYSTDYFIELGITSDWKNNTKNMLMLDQPSFGLSRNNLVQGVKSEAVQAYHKYMVDIAILLGADEEQATKELMKSLKFEIKLASITLSEENRRNYTLLNNPMTVSELMRKYPSVNWKDYINELLPQTVRVDAKEVVMVKEPDYISKLEKLLRNTSKRVQANYVLWRVTAESVEYLTERFRKRNLEYSYSLMGVEAVSSPRWKECLDVVSESSMSTSMNALYVRKFFKEGARQNAVEMVAGIRNELIKLLKNSEWMDDRTRGRAIDKTKAMFSHVAYPVEFLHDNKLEELYETHSDFSRDDFLGNILISSLFKTQSRFKTLRKLVNNTEWIAHDESTQINAYYDFTENSVQIPAGVLQGVVFGKDRPRYMNYGAIGYMIGHEMTHSFDNEGRQFDKDGNLADWWTPETAQKYLKKAQCIINQYSNYTVPAIGLNVNGENTQGENIADNGGIKEAYFAYKEYVRKHGPEQKLPGLEYTPDQLFWISAANIWCVKFRPEAARYELTSDVHSPARFRVIGPFSNMPEFSEDFNCPLGSNMNPKHKCSVF